MEIKEALSKAIKKATSKQSLKKYGNQVVDDIKRRTRLGFGVKEHGGKRYSLSSKPLSAAYLKFRKKHKKLLHGETSPTKHNLTFTGQLLNAMKAEVKSRTIEVNFHNRRPPKPSNAEIAGYVSKDRPFLNMSDRELQRLIKEIENVLTKAFEKNFKG